MTIEFQHLPFSEGLLTLKTQAERIITDAVNTITRKDKAEEVAKDIDGFITQKWADAGIRPLTPRDSTLLQLKTQDAIAEKALNVGLTKCTGPNASKKEEKIADICHGISRVNKVSTLILKHSAAYQAPADAQAITDKDVDFAKNLIKNIDEVEQKDINAVVGAARQGSAGARKLVAEYAKGKVPDQQIVNALYETKSEAAAKTIETYAAANKLDLMDLVKVVSQEEKLKPTLKLDRTLAKIDMPKEQKTSSIEIPERLRRLGDMLRESGQLLPTVPQMGEKTAAYLS